MEYGSAVWILGLFLLITLTAAGVYRLIVRRQQTEALLLNSEKRYRNLFENAPISLWQADFSALKSYLDNLRAEGVKDIEAYFNKHPEALTQCATTIKIIDVNQETLKMYAAVSKEELQAKLKQRFNRELLEPFKKQLIALFKGYKIYEQEFYNTLSGERIDIAMKLSLTPGYEQSWSNVLISMINITERKTVEAALQEAHDNLQARVEELETLNLITQMLSHVSDLNAALKIVAGVMLRILNVQSASVGLFGDTPEG